MVTYECKAQIGDGKGKVSSESRNFDEITIKCMRLSLCFYTTLTVDMTMCSIVCLLAKEKRKKKCSRQRMENNTKPIA